MPEIKCRHAQVHDLKQIKEIIRLSFEDIAKHPVVLDDIEDETWFSTEHWLVAEIGGRVASTMGLRPGVMWMSGVAVPTTTVGLVCTLPDLRGQRIGESLMAFAAEFMRKQGVVLSRLHTYASRYAFYGRLGYVKAINNHSAGVLDVEVIPPATVAKAEAEQKAAIRPAQVRDAERLNHIYEATFSRVTGCISRNGHFFVRRIEQKPKVWLWDVPKIVVADDPRDGVLGYIAYSLDAAHQYGEIAELATVPMRAGLARTLLLHAARDARQAGVKKLSCFVDSHSPFGWIDHEFHVDVPSDSSVVFLKVHDEERFLDMMRPVIQRRAVRHEVGLTLSLAGIGDIRLGGGQQVRIVTDAGHLASLVYNGEWLAGLMGQGALFIHPETLSAHEAVRMIFPDTHAYRCRMDGY